MSDDLEIRVVKNYWLHTARSITILGINGFIALPILGFLFYIRIWTFMMVIIIAVALVIMQRFGYTPIVAFRALRSRLGGKNVTRNRRIGRHRIWK